MIAPAYRYRASLARIVDGDTFHARIDLGFFVSVDVSVRVRGVDTPERGEPNWAEARAYLASLLSDHELVIESYHDRRSFERWVCDVYLPTGENIADVIIARGLGVPA